MKKFSRKKDKARKEKQSEQKRWADLGYGSPTDYSSFYGEKGKDKK